MQQIKQGSFWTGAALASVAALIGACAQSGPPAAEKPKVVQAAPEASQAAAVKPPPAVRRIDPMADVAGDKPLPPLKGAAERFDCATGTSDLHRIGLEARGGQVTYFTYYNKWQLRTCSLEVTRDAAGTKWRQTSDGATRVQIPQGRVVIRARNDAYEFEFQDVERRGFCGTAGLINGTFTAGRSAAKRACSVTGFANTDDN